MFSMDFIAWHHPYTNAPHHICFQAHIRLRILIQTILAGVCCSKVQSGQIFQHNSRLSSGDGDGLSGSQGHNFKQQIECDSRSMVRRDHGPQYHRHMTSARSLEPGR